MYLKINIVNEEILRILWKLRGTYDDLIVHADKNQILNI